MGGQDPYIPSTLLLDTHLFSGPYPTPSCWSHPSLPAVRSSLGLPPARSYPSHLDHTLTGHDPVWILKKCWNTVQLLSNAAKEETISKFFENSMSLDLTEERRCLWESHWPAVYTFLGQERGLRREPAPSTQSGFVCRLAPCHLEASSEPGGDGKENECVAVGSWRPVSALRAVPLGVWDVAGVRRAFLTARRKERPRVSGTVWAFSIGDGTGFRGARRLEGQQKGFIVSGSIAAPFWKTKTSQKLVFVQGKQNSYSVIASQTPRAWRTLLYFLARPSWNNFISERCRFSETTCLLVFALFACVVFLI